MFKIIAINSSIQQLFATEANGDKAVVRFLVNPNTKKPIFNKFARINSASTKTGELIVKPFKGLAIDAHYHPNGDLEPSVADMKTMKESNLIGIIIYSDEGMYRLIANQEYQESAGFNPLRLIVYGYCNIKESISTSMKNILGSDYEKNQHILDVMDKEIAEIEGLIREFCGSKEGNIASMKSLLEQWIVGSEFAEYLNSLNIDDHAISHIIEDFMVKYPNPKKYKEHIEELAKMIFKTVAQADYAEFQLQEEHKAFADSLLSRIKGVLGEDGEDSFLNRLEVKMTSITEKVNEKIKAESKRPSNIDNSDSNGNGVLPGVQKLGASDAT